MAKIDIRRAHGKSAAEARAVVDKVGARMAEKFGTKGAWQGDTYAFSGTGVKGGIAVSDAEVHVTAELGLMLSAFKAKIEDEIRGKLDQYFV
ncbi:polyhydroxyalkanoic acid system family protein [Luteibacter yeojuensis]|uniref:Polyhydroxyalkanoic acid synthase n=1 Tax=Luteibacter yeojuensis TaxID=345309 RepID=A0A0F3KZ12_9GAMM|nr:polyhydroxyalkanoic acid system family protein [Luteibacter yeojuensis]KJV36177.1 polyhydroxyalkanoic acid synthase [Luteibacter yeojuensis]